MLAFIYFYFKIIMLISIHVCKKFYLKKNLNENISMSNENISE